MINTHRHLATAALLVPMLPRGNADQFTEFAESDKLEVEIRKNLAGLGYEC